MLFGVTGSAFAQNLEEVVYLKNGSVIRGTIVEQVPNESVKIQTRDGNLFVYRMDEIQKISKEQAGNSYSRNRSQSSTLELQRGYFGMINFGYEIGVSGGTDRVKFDVINGYQIIPEFSIGAGIGVKYFINAETVTIPIYAHLRSDFLRNKTTPFIALNAGYNISTDEYLKGGALVEPSVGIGFRNNNNKQVNISLGYSLNYFKSEMFGYSVKVRSDALMIHLGIMW